MACWNCIKGRESATDLDRGRLVMRDANLPVIWVFGGRCSGKTTLSMKIVEKYDLLHIDCDNVLRFEALRQSSRGVDIMARLNRHERLPYDILVRILREILPRHVKVTKGYVLDNFPWNVEQGKLFEEKVCKMTIILYLKMNQKTMLKRYKKRDNEMRDSQIPMTSGDLFYRPVAVHDVVLQQERIETQLNDFQILAPEILDRFASRLHTLDAERSENELFGKTDSIIDELSQKYDIPNRRNVNYILMKNFLVEKSSLPQQEEFTDDDRPSAFTRWSSRLPPGSRGASDSSRKRSRQSREKSKRRQVSENLEPKARSSSISSGERKALGRSSNQSNTKETGRSSRLLVPKNKNPSKVRERTTPKNDSAGRSQSPVRDSKDRNKSTRDSDPNERSKKLFHKKNTDDDAPGKRLKGSEDSTDSVPMVRNSTYVRKSRLSRRIEEIPDSTIESPGGSVSYPPGQTVHLDDRNTEMRNKRDTQDSVKRNTDKRLHSPSKKRSTSFAHRK